MSGSKAELTTQVMRAAGKRSRRAVRTGSAVDDVAQGTGLDEGDPSRFHSAPVANGHA